MTPQITTAASYTTSTATVVAGLTINEWGVAIGIFIAALTYATNVWFKFRAEKKP